MKLHQTSRAESRRAFLKKTAMAGAALAGLGVTSTIFPACAETREETVGIVPEPGDAVVEEPAVQWAVEQLRRALEARGMMARVRQNLDEAAADYECILVATSGSPAVRQAMQREGLSAPKVPESLVLARGRVGRRRLVLASGSDARGLIYALLELADRVRLGVDPLVELRHVQLLIQQPANQIRSISRLFASDVEDKGWFNDRVFWQEYLTQLTSQRFNHFSLALGLGYDFTTDIHDAYLHFAYPFLVAPPGYNVRAVPLPDDERKQNLAMLQFISEETVRRGLQFRLGLWTHAYKWVDSPHANYVIEGLTPETHAAYCRDALAALLDACPAIGGITFRIHGESGIAEGSYDFWKTVFDGVAHCGRRVEIDLHAKGIDEQMIQLALDTQMPVTVAPKFWAEHFGLGYMQGAIRPQEMPPKEDKDKGFFAKSSGSRRFLRYGYGDLLREDRRYGVLHRIWPGTQRLLLWGDPELAADYGRASSFCGSLGVEWMEPLSFKGRKGSGLPGGRNGYEDESLKPEEDFEKYLYSYRVWGRRIYDPNCDPEEWRRLLRKGFGSGALAVESALGQASRILPLVTTAHCPSAANNNYWPEMYTNMPIVDPKRPHPYGDTLSPKQFGTVSSLDPEFFSRIDDFAQALLEGDVSAKYSPAWVAAELESYATESAKALAAAKRKVRDSGSPEFRRLAADVAIQSGLGQFFAWKFRAGVLFAIYERTQYQPALEQALKAYRRARDAWAKFAHEAKPIYRSDVTFGPGKFQRGHWLDRLAAIDEDIADMEKLLKEPSQPVADPARSDLHLIEQAIATVLRASPGFRQPGLPAFHQPPKSFRRGEMLLVEASLKKSKGAPKLGSLLLHFRRVNQGETWQVKEMEAHGTSYGTSIPADYADSQFPLQYYFEFIETSGAAWLYPGLKPGWNGQPYFVVRQE